MSSHEGLILINVFKANSADFMVCIQTVSETAEKEKAAVKVSQTESNRQLCKLG